MENKVIKNIKRIMEIENCSQKELSLNLGLSEVAISRYLRGNRKLTIEFIYKIAKYFNVSIDWLINEK